VKRDKEKQNQTDKSEVRQASKKDGRCGEAENREIGGPLIALRSQE
jgi:hypothetical protein